MTSIANVDLRLLKVFIAVADCGGFSAAQAELNISQSTVSNHMLALEQRLHCRLCQRGRAGFELTAEGQVVYDAAVRLFSSIDDFRNQTESLRGVLTGELRIGIVDNTVTDPESPLVEAIRRFSKRANSVHIRFTIDPPMSLQRQLIDRQLDIAVLGFAQMLPNLRYQPLYVERTALYCGNHHALFSRDEADVRLEDVQKAPFASRGYWRNQDTHRLGTSSAATVDQMEPLLMLILSGAFIGYLPVHYAQHWVSQGRLKPLLEQELSYGSQFHLATRKGLRMTPLTKAFVKDVRSTIAGRGAAPGDPTTRLDPLYSWQPQGSAPARAGSHPVRTAEAVG